MRYSFSGHESFPCKSLWLKKGFDFVSHGGKFSSEDAVLRLGVGKNMVTSIRFWLKAFEILQDDSLSSFSRFVFDEIVGKDPYMEDNGTLWMLHYYLVKSAVSSIYNLTFLSFQRETKEFGKDQLHLFLKRKCNVPEQKNVYNENTVSKDIRVLLQNYVKTKDIKALEESSTLLSELNLIREVSNDKYVFSETRKENVDPEVVLYCLLDMKKDDKTISFDTLQELSLLFCIPIVSLLEIIQDIEDRYPNDIKYTDNSGVKNVQFLNEIDKFEILKSYYGKR